MEDKNNAPLKSVLRQKAEELLQKRAIVAIENYSDTEILNLIHELEVHQIELEVQNDALNSLMCKAEIEAEKYTNLYDFAPCGYFTITKKEEILETNFSGAALLGKERSQLLNKRFGYFIADKSKPTFFEFLEKIFESKTSQTCEIVLSGSSKISTHVFLTGIVNGGSDQCLLTMVDISQVKDSEKAVHKSKLLLKSTLESQQDTIILSIDKDYNYLSFNKAHSDGMKQSYNVDVKVGMNILDCISSIEDRKVAKENYDRALNGESHSNIRIYGVKEKAHFESFFNPIVDEDNNIIGATALARNITNRIQNENKLKISEENLQSLFDSVADAIYVLDTSGIFINVNKSAEKMYLCSKQELIGKSCKSVAAPNLNDLDKVYKISQEVFETGAPCTFEFWAVRKNGEIFPKEIIINRGKYLGKTVIIASARDITERKKIENSLQKSQEKLEGIFNVANSGIFLLDSFGNFLMFNDWFCKSLGYTRNEFQELNVKAVSHPEDLEKSNALNQKIINCEIEKYQIEKRYIRKDKSILWCEVSASAIKDQNDNVVNIIKVIYDITARKQAEQELINEKRRLALILIGTGAGTWEWNIHSGSITINERWAALIGYTLEELAPVTIDTWRKYTHPDDVKYSEANLEKHLKGAVDYCESEFRMQHKNGNWIWILSRGAINERDLNGEPLFMSGTHLDITERKEAEKLIVQSKTRFSSIINSSPVAMALNDENLNITYLNQAFYDMFGYTIAEIPTVHEWFPKAFPNIEYRKKISTDYFTALEKTKQTGADFAPMEHIVRCKDGSDKTVMVSASLLLHSDRTEHLVNFYDITARKQAEQALEQEKRRLALILIGTGAGTWEWNIQTGETIFNEQWAALIGYTIEELSPVSIETWKKFTHPDDVKRTEEILEKYFERNLDYYECEFRMKHKNGDWIWILDRGSVNEWDIDGKPLLMSGTHLDITERKEAEKLIVQSKTRFSSIINSSPVAMSLNDENLNITYLNQAFYGMFGYTIAEIPTVHEWFPKAFPNLEYRKKISKSWITALETVKQTGADFAPMEVLIRCKDGSDKTIMVSATRLFNSNDTEYLINFYDITAQKQAEQALIAEKRRLALILIGTGAGTWEWTVQSGIIVINERWAELIGYTIKELGPVSFDTWRRYTHPDDAKLTEKIIEKYFQGAHDYYESEFRMKHKNGDWVWILSRGKINKRDLNGEPLSMSGTHLDITERKRSEEKLIASEAELRHTQIIANLGSFTLDFTTQKWTSCGVLDKIFGINPSFEKTMETWNLLLHPDYISIVNNYVYIEVIGKKKNFNKEYKIITLDQKEVRWVHTMGELTFDSAGNPILLVGSVQDITERKVVEEKLKLTSEKFQDLVNSTGGIVWEADAYTCKFTYVSNQAERLLGYSAEEWYVDDFWVNHIHPEDKQNVIDYCASQTKKMEAHDFTYRFIAKNGEFIWLRDIVNVVAEDGKPKWLRGVMFDVTHFKETNLLLSESEEKYRGLVENAPYGIIIYVGDKVAFINAEVLKMAQAKDKNELIGRSVLDFVHPDSMEDIAYRMTQVHRDENASDIVEAKLMTVDGIPLYVELKAIPTVFEHKQAVQLIIQDISVQKQSAVDLNKINRVYALISQINDLIIRVHNREELFKEICNIAVCFGKFRMSWIGFLNDDNTISTAAFAGFENGYFAERDLTSFRNVQEKRGPTRIALNEGRAIICNDIAHDPMMEPFRNEALQRGYYSMISIPILVRDKNIAAFNLYSDEKNFFSSEEEISLLEKISLNIAFALESILVEEERKQNEQKIRQLSQAVEQSPVTVLITNTEGKIEYANPKFVETTGYTLEEVIGKNPRFLKSGHTTGEEYKKLWSNISIGQTWHGEFYNKKKDGTLYWESATISPILNAQGKATHFIGIKEDITERKIAEQELIDAKLKAEESDRLKLAFLANMSHEIRTPMNGILGFTELLKAPDLSGTEQNEFISIIEKSGQRMLNIINDIINISKVEAGQVEVTLSETNVNEQLNYIYSFFTPEANQKGIHLVIKKQLSPKYNLLLTDNEKLYAVLTNLVKNAIKFTNEGSIEFGCEKKGVFLEFFVKDSGIGISDSQKGIVFERFRQASESVSRSHEGSGLGLAISKAYIEKLGGKIWVDSEKGKGSTFYFTIPLQSESENDFENDCEETIKTEKENLEMQEENKIKGLKVLIVEDDPISKLLLTFVIKSFSKEIIKVSSGIEAIEACNSNPDIDLVMMDANMPEMGGYEATRLIREFNKDVVIIAQTANALQSDRNDAIEAGCTDYISKPINSAELKTMIQKYFNK